MVARNVCWRSGRSRPPPTSSLSECTSRSRIASGGSSLTRAAASSMASGRPSSRRTIWATAAAFRSSTAKPGTAAAARSANSRTDSHAATDSGVVSASSCGTASGGTGHSCSPDTRRGERLLTRMRRSRAAPSNSATTGAADSRCSKLSRTIRSCGPADDLAQMLHQRRPPGIRQPDALGDRRGHQSRLPDRRQPDEIHAIGIIGRHLRGQCNAQARLAAAARSGQREQAAAFEEPPRLRQLPLPADETRQRPGQAARTAVEAPARGRAYACGSDQGIRHGRSAR